MLKEWPTFQSERVLSRRAETDSNRSHIETAACVQILPAESKHLARPRVRKSWTALPGRRPSVDS